MQITNLILLAGALVATAQPFGHGHRHEEFHDKRDPKQGFKAIHKHHGSSSSTASTTTPSASPSPAPPSTTTSAAAQAASTGTGTYIPFCPSGSAKKRATAEEIAEPGNTGNVWGCNIMPIAEDIYTLYDYVTKFENVDSQSYEVVLYDKVGEDGGVDGSFELATSFTLAPGAVQYVAFAPDSLGGASFAPGSVPKSQYGQWAGSMYEFSFGVSSSGEIWNGGDCSSLIAVSAGAQVYGCQTCAFGVCSTIEPGGNSFTNAYGKTPTVDTTNVDGLGWKGQGNVLATVLVGYSG